jgi:hypothetical protein
MSEPTTYEYTAAEYTTALMSGEEGRARRVGGARSSKLRYDGMFNIIVGKVVSSVSIVLLTKTARTEITDSVAFIDKAGEAFSQKAISFAVAIGGILIGELIARDGTRKADEAKIINLQLDAAFPHTAADMVGHSVDPQVE